MSKAPKKKIEPAPPLDDLNMFNKPEEEEEAGDQNMPDEEQDEDFALFAKEDESDEGDQNF
jgi:hypothetical protein